MWPHLKQLAWISSRHGNTAAGQRREGSGLSRLRLHQPRIGLRRLDAIDAALIAG